MFRGPNCCLIFQDCRLADPESLDVDESNKMGVRVQEKDLHCKTPLSSAEVVAS